MFYTIRTAISDFIYKFPWLFVGLSNLFVALVLSSFVPAIHIAIPLLFVAVALYGFALELSTKNEIGIALTVDKKMAKKFHNSHIAASNEYADEIRDGVFLGHASNVYTPAQLEEMAKSEDPRVQALAALNPLLPVTSLESLSHSSNKGVLNAVASNRRTPSAVRSRILYTKIFDTNSEDAQRELLSDPETPGYALQKIYQSPYNVREVYTALVKHPNTPKELFNTLTDGNNLNVLIAIGQSPSLIDNKELVAKLKRFNDYDIVEAVLTNPLMNTRTLDLYNPVDDHLRPNLNVVVRNPALKLSPATMAWIARNAASFRSLMIERLKSQNPDLENFPTDAILKLY